MLEVVSNVKVPYFEVVCPEPCQVHCMDSGICNLKKMEKLFNMDMKALKDILLNEKKGRA